MRGVLCTRESWKMDALRAMRGRVPNIDDYWRSLHPEVPFIQQISSSECTLRH